MASQWGNPGLLASGQLDALFKLTQFGTRRFPLASGSLGSELEVPPGEQSTRSLKSACAAPRLGPKGSRTVATLF